MQDTGPKYEKHLWLVPFLYGALLIAASTFWLVRGTPFDQATYERISGLPWRDLVMGLPSGASSGLSALVRLTGGNSGLLAGIMVIAVSVGGYRRHAKWAWYALWALPLHAALDLVILSLHGGTTPSAAAWDIGLISATLLALFLPYRRFFPRSP
jgi:hypothetical protein